MSPNQHIQGPHRKQQGAHMQQLLDSGSPDQVNASKIGHIHAAHLPWKQRTRGHQEIVEGPSVQLQHIISSIRKWRVYENMVTELPLSHMMRMSLGRMQQQVLLLPKSQL